MNCALPGRPAVGTCGSGVDGVQQLSVTMTRPRYSPSERDMPHCAQASRCAGTRPVEQHTDEADRA
jgi:hypothetical protein